MDTLFQKQIALNQVIEPIAEELKTLFPKGEDKGYSIGFVRILQLTKKQRKNAFLALYLEGFTSLLENHLELKRRFENMSEIEFKLYKANNK